EYAFGSKFDRDGNLWVVLCLTGSFGRDALYRGWCFIGSPDRLETIPTASRIWLPGGIAGTAAGHFFYSDNQGPSYGACSLKWLRPGSFQGHPICNKGYKATGGAIGDQPTDPASNSRMMVEAKKIPQLEPPAVYFPYGKMGQSASGIACDLSNG